MNFADAYAVCLIVSFMIAMWEGIIKPLVNFIILQLFGVKFVVTVYYEDPMKHASRMPTHKEYGLLAHSSDGAILMGLKAFKNDWVSKSDKIPLSCVTKVDVRSVD